MKLIECYIENFGKLSHFSHKFSDGMNIFCRENGWGKSTFAGFIKAMFYGLTTSRSLDASLNERVRYLPWQGGSCGGTLTFSIGDEIYRVERTFGAKESQDTFALYDCKTGLASDAYSERLGEEIFEIDAGGYERSTYISERLTADTRPDYTGIQAKLVDMNDLSDYLIAEKALEKRRKYYYVQGGRGAIAETSTKLSSKRAELAEAEIALQKTNELNRRARALDEERTILEGQLRRAHSRIDASLSHRTEEALAAHKQNLEENLARTREATASCRAYLSANVPTPGQLEEQSQNWRTLKNTKISDIKPRIIPAWLPILLFIVGVGAVLGGGLLGVITKNWLLLGLFAVAGVIFLGLGVSLTFSRKRAADTARILAASRREYDRLSTSLARFLADYPIVQADPALHDDGERLWAIRTKTEDLGKLTRLEAEASSAYHDFRTTHPALFTNVQQAQPDEEVLAAKADETRITAEINRIHAERAACEREIAKYASLAGRYTACAQEISRLEEIKRTQEKSLDIIQLTQQFLLSSRTSLTSRYLDDIQKNFRAYMRILTEVDRDSVFSDEYSSETYTVTPDFTVNMTKFGKTRAATTLSRGGRDLVALCLRFAITDALFEGKKPPLILDDPFINLDDSKIGAAMALLTRVAEERQIFYVSCHSSRA